MSSSAERVVLLGASVQIENKCSFCNDEPESITHITIVYIQLLLGSELCIIGLYSVKPIIISKLNVKISFFYFEHENLKVEFIVNLLDFIGQI